MDAITNPALERVSVKKSARVGYTKILNHALAYHIHQDPCSMMVVQPTVEDAEGYSKEEIAPMLRDTPALAGLVSDAKTKDGSNSILHKLFNGGQLSLVGANSPRGFRRVSRRIVAFDETSGYPRSAGTEGSPIKLGIKRTEYFWNRKIIDGSTPGLEGLCAIDAAFLAGDQRRRFLPCPTCGHMQYLKFENMHWPKDEPTKAYFECEGAKCRIEHDSLRWMDENGEWIATAVPKNPKHASFHIWSAYSYSPNSTWGHIATEYLDCLKDNEALKTFTNTVLGETWTESGEVPEFKRLHERRETWATNSLQPGVVFLTCGVDVQQDRLELEVVGWGRDKQSWSIDYRVIMGETATKVPWDELDKVLNETWKTASGSQIQIRMLTVDAGYNTTHVYNWVKNKPSDRVRAIKGSDSLQMVFGQPKEIHLNREGSKLKRANRVWPVGVSVIKSELYSWLKLDGADDAGIFKSGFCHFPQYEEEYFKRLCSEHLVSKKVNGKTVRRWLKIHERNEPLDVRVYARAAASMFGMDRFAESDWEVLEGKFDLPTTQNSDAVHATPTSGRMSDKPKQSDYWARQNSRKKLW